MILYRINYVRIFHNSFLSKRIRWCSTNNNKNTLDKGTQKEHQVIRKDSDLTSKHNNSPAPSQNDQIIVASTELSPRGDETKESLVVRERKFQLHLKELKRETKDEEISQEITPKGYAPDGDKNEFNVDAELGPTIDDWDIAPYHKLNKEPPGQKLFKAEKEDIEILTSSKWKFFSVYDNPNGIVYRLVRISDEVTSPVLRVKHNYQVGVRPQDEWRVLGGGYALAALCLWACLWQTKRLEWKRGLTEYRRTRITHPITVIDKGPLPWMDDLENWEYKCVELRGVIDPSKTMYVGPRDMPRKLRRPGFFVIQVLRLKDGTCVLVNRGHLHNDDLNSNKLVEVSCASLFSSSSYLDQAPSQVIVKGYINPGEKLGSMRWLMEKLFPLTYSGEAANTKFWKFMEPGKLAQHAGVTDVDGVGQAIVEAYDWFYVDDSDVPREERMIRPASYLMLADKKDAFYFFLTEHWHLNYAIQWGLLSLWCFGVVTAKYIHLRKWKF